MKTFKLGSGLVLFCALAFAMSGCQKFGKRGPAGTDGAEVEGIETTQGRAQGLMVQGLAVSPGEIVLHAADASVVKGAWSLIDDSTAASGKCIYNPDNATAKVEPALAAPADYFELQFYAEANVPYRLWARGRADKNSYNNDALNVQLSGSVDASTGAALFQIGSTSAMNV